MGFSKSAAFLALLLACSVILIPACGAPPAPPSSPGTTVLAPSAQEKWQEILDDLKRDGTPAPNPPPAPVTPAPAPLPAPVPPAPPVPAPPPPAPVPAPVPVPAPAPTATLALDPARNIVGTWQGKGSSYVMEGGTARRLVKITWDVTLRITGVNGNVPRGNLTLIDVKHDNLTAFNQLPRNWGPDDITDGQVGDTRLYFRVDDWRWEFTFTSDLMSGQYTSNNPNECDPKAFVLNKART